jgi:hypothetical protein
MHGFGIRVTALGSRCLVSVLRIPTLCGVGWQGRAPCTMHVAAALSQTPALQQLLFATAPLLHIGTASCKVEVQVGWSHMWGNRVGQGHSLQQVAMMVCTPSEETLILQVTRLRQPLHGLSTPTHQQPTSSRKLRCSA